MQENTTIRERTELLRRSLRVACLLLAAAALTGCDEQPSPNASTTKVVNDSASLYAALSATLEQCDEAYEACLDAAGESRSAQMQCEANAELCRAQTQPMENECERTLEREAHHCHSICGDEDAGVDDADAGSGDMNQCITRHAPRLPMCLSGLVACLDEAGICNHEVSRSEFHDCVRATHRCIKDELRTLRERKHKWWHRHRAGSAAAGSGGAGGTAGAAEAGSGGAATAGSGGDPGVAGSGGTPVSPSDIDPAQAGSGGSCDDDGSGAEAGSGGAGGSDDGRSERRRHPWFPFSKR